jgi:hypothetical protein
MDGYAEVPTRPAWEGTADKLALCEAMATKYSTNRAFAEKVLQVVANAGNAADQQAACWAAFVESLPYRREPGEVLRDPLETTGLGSRGAGGDCDDLVVVLLAGMRALAIPCYAEVMTKSDGQAFHIRGRVGLPPLNPQTWAIVDPVWKSEAEWAMQGRPPGSNVLLQGRSFSLAGTIEPTSSTPNWWTALALALGVATAYLTRKWWKPK